MSGFQEFQRKKDEEMKNSDNTGVKILGFSLIGFVILMFILILFGQGSEENGCEDIGGEFVVVGEEYSPALKHTIDVYGCIK